MSAPLLASRYRLYEPIASGGMATVHFGRLIGEVGFARIVAIKRVLRERMDSGSVAGLVDEARLASRIQHPNVVPTLDVFVASGELFVVMELVTGETLANLKQTHAARAEPIPVPITLSVGIGLLQGVHAAHEAKNERGQPLSIVHRDVSPQNVIVGVDGLARVLDFGIAKAAERMTLTMAGQVKGKPRYMSPEQLLGEPVTRATDIFAAGVILWEMLAGRRLYETDREVIVAVSQRRLPEPTAKYNADVPEMLDAIIRRAVAFDPYERFGDAASFALALEECGEVASPRRVGEWVKAMAREDLSARAAMIAAIEQDSNDETGADLFARAPLFEATQPTVDSAPPELDAWRSGAQPRKDVAKPARPSLVIVALACSALAGVLVVFLILGGRGNATSTATATPSAPSAAEPGAEARVSVEPREPRADLASSLAAPPEPSTSATMAASTLAEPIAPAVKPRSTASSARTRSPWNPCSPPFTIDKNGVRRFKPECVD